MGFKSSRGFSIVEALVALLLVSSAVTSAFTLQTFGMKTLSSSRANSHADWLARDLIERIRSNPTGNYQLNGGGPLTACNVCSTADEVAQRDLYEWWAQVRQTPLSNPSGYIVKRPDLIPSINHFTIALQWDSAMLLPQSDPLSACQEREEGRVCYVAEVLL